MMHGTTSIKCYGVFTARYDLILEVKKFDFVPEGLCGEVLDYKCNEYNVRDIVSQQKRNRFS